MGSRKTIVFIITFVLFVPLLSFTLPQLAVLEAILAAGIDPTVGPLVTSKIEEEFVNSGKYRVLDRANVGGYRYFTASFRVVGAPIFQHKWGHPAARRYCRVVERDVVDASGPIPRTGRYLGTFYQPTCIRV